MYRRGQCRPSLKITHLDGQTKPFEFHAKCGTHSCMNTNRSSRSRMV